MKLARTKIAQSMHLDRISRVLLNGVKSRYTLPILSVLCLLSVVLYLRNQYSMSVDHYQQQAEFIELIKDRLAYCERVEMTLSWSDKRLSIRQRLEYHRNHLEVMNQAKGALAAADQRILETGWGGYGKICFLSFLLPIVCWIGFTRVVRNPMKVIHKPGTNWFPHSSVCSAAYALRAILVSFFPLSLVSCGWMVNSYWQLYLRRTLQINLVNNVAQQMQVRESFEKSIGPVEHLTTDDFVHRYSALQLSLARLARDEHGIRQKFASPPLHYDLSTWFHASLLFPAGMAAYLLYMIHIRRPEMCCLQCGYDLRATPERCPECGAARKKDIA